MDWAEKLDDLLKKYIPQMKVIADEPAYNVSHRRAGKANGVSQRWRANGAAGEFCDGVRYKAFDYR